MLRDVWQAEYDIAMTTAGTVGQLRNVSEFIEKCFQDGTSVKDVLAGPMKIADPESAIGEAEMLLLAGNDFRLQLHHPYRPMKGWANDIRKQSELLPQDKKAFGALVQQAEKLITNGNFTDVGYLHPPDRIGLAAFRAACKDQGISIDAYLDTFVGLASPEEVVELKGMLDEIEVALRSEVVAETLETLGDIWTRAFKVWGKLGKKNKKKGKDKEDGEGEPTAKKAKKEKKEKKEKN